MISNTRLSCSDGFRNSVDNKNMRIEWVDIAKGIGMLLVVWAHIHDTGDLCTVIYSFHMPLFFVLSGYLFKTDKYNGIWEFLMKKKKSLIMPYLMLSFITLLFYILINKVYWQGLSGFTDSENLKYLIQIFVA